MTRDEALELLRSQFGAWQHEYGEDWEQEAREFTDALRALDCTPEEAHP